MQYRESMMTLTEAELHQCDDGIATRTEPYQLPCTPVLLPSRQFLATDDPAEAELAIREMLTEHRISLLGPASDFHASVTLAEVADLRIAHFRYGTALDITGSPLGRYAINFTLHGVSRIRHGDQRAAAATGAATIFSPVADSQLTWSSDLDVLCVVIPTDALEQHFRKITGVSEPLYFHPGVDSGTAHLARSIVTSILRLNVGGTIDLPEPLAWELRNALLTAIVTELPHDHSAVLRRASSPGTERTALAAVAAMRRQLALPPTIPQLAGQLGVSERTLLSVFHEHFSTTPSAYFKRMRLEAVHDALLHSRPRDITVTRVAAEAGGFLHLGRFAGEYLAMFGEHPADTLRSSANGAR
jgi:AraC-like DNA-binding protein